jgi:4-hydroxy-3-polyprenylbenzoate decarboxylase
MFMGYRNLRACVDDLERHGQLRRIDIALDPNLEIGSIQRRVYRAGGPALLFTRVAGSEFPLLGNLFGTLERTRFLFRDTLRAIERIIAAKLDPGSLLKAPVRALGLPFHAKNLLPKKVSSAPVMSCQTTLAKLPQLISWPDDGGAFITLPQVYSEMPGQPGWRHSNLGMYRVQISGNQYRPNQEAGLHYQIHRGIGVHHREAQRRGEPLRVNVFVGGPPSLTVAAVMPLPEGLPELAFAGLLGGHRIALANDGTHLPLPAEADFCLCGTIDPEQTLPEGPFGDHLGYYSLTHPFPVLRVEQVYHRPDAIWPFTTVGRPPQEDTSFGAFIHELTGDLIPAVLPGVRGVHAVDAAGVHPLLLAIGSERYTPYSDPRRPQELLTQAHAILGQGQLSLAKYLLIVAENDAPGLDLHDIPAFFRHLLERIDLRRDLHFETRTTMDTLDYSGSGLNSGSKLVMAATGPKLRNLATEIPPELNLPQGFGAPRTVLPGVLAVTAPGWRAEGSGNDPALAQFCKDAAREKLAGFPLIVLVDDSPFVSASLENFLWVVFTRSDPAVDIDGIGAAVEYKHWGCTGSLVIDARLKPQHAPPLEEDPAVVRRIEDLAAPGQPLHGLF